MRPDLGHQRDALFVIRRNRGLATHGAFVGIDSDSESSTCPLVTLAVSA
jgi:hypothetical protein